MAAYDNKVLNGEHLNYLVQLIKNADNSVASGIPGALADLTDDATHRVVTDTEKSTWNGKANTADIPTAVSALTNDSGYQTSAQVQSAISTAIAGVSTFGFEIVQTLPVSDIATNKIYLVAKATAGTNNVYTEYAYINNSWEILGDTQVTIDTLTNTEIQTIWDNVTTS